jgi:hypothetical protein
MELIPPGSKAVVLAKNYESFLRKHKPGVSEEGLKKMLSDLRSKDRYKTKAVFRRSDKNIISVTDASDENRKDARRWPQTIKISAEPEVDFDKPKKESVKKTLLAYIKKRREKKAKASAAAERVFDNPDLRNLILGKRKDMMMFEKMKEFIEDLPSSQTDSADDENPHSQDFESLFLKDKETKSKAAFPYFYFYGGNGSGRKGEALAFMKAYTAIKPSFELERKEKAVESVAPFLRTFEGYDNMDEEDFEDTVDDFNPMDSGILVLTIKVKDAKQRKEANQFIKTWQEAMDKVLNK